MIGIYCIRNLINNKVYVGASKDVYSRIENHRNLLNIGRHHSKSLMADWLRYGECSFKFEVLEESDDQLSLVESERVWMNKLDALKNGYNISSGKYSSHKRTKPRRIEQKINVTSVNYLGTKNTPLGAITRQERSNLKKESIDAADKLFECLRMAIRLGYATGEAFSIEIKFKENFTNSEECDLIVDREQLLSITSSDFVENEVKHFFQRDCLKKNTLLMERRKRNQLTNQ